MPAKTILVCLNTVERAGELLRVSCNLAERQEAHLIGLYVIPGIQYYSVPSGMHGAVDINESQRNYYDEHAEATHSAFEDAVRKSGVSGEWRLIRSEHHLMSGLAVEHGMQADLIVAGQTPPEGYDSFEPEFAERLIMESGRPVLVVPHTGQFQSVATDVVVGWNKTPQAARAVGDSLALLTSADRTTIACINPEKEFSGDNLPGSELATMLARHGVTVSSETTNDGSASTGEVLLRKAGDLGADLVVIGAFGHSRLREYVFGGVTQHCLSNMTVPVLLSH